MNILFSPYDALKLSNRVVMAPMTRNQSKNHIPGPDVADYYRRRAEGEVGLIITEGTPVGHKAANAYPDVPFFFGKAALEGWKKVVDEVHSAGGKIFPQLWHVGSVRQTHDCQNGGVDQSGNHSCEQSKIPGFAPSAVVHPYIKQGQIPHVMSKQDISAVIEAFAQAAVNAKNLGFDGVEIHGAHGYLIDQFFWDRTNRRTDEYGGAKIGLRTRFAVELIQAVRQAVGPHFPIDFRFSQWKLGDYEARLVQSPQELESFLLPLVEAGVDLFHCSTRRFWETEFSGSPLNLAAWTRKITGKPTIAVGSVGLDLDFVSTVMGDSSAHSSMGRIDGLIDSLQRGDFDLIALGRALLADPFWVKKMREGKSREIIPFTKELLSRLT